MVIRRSTVEAIGMRSIDIVLKEEGGEKRGSAKCTKSVRRTEGAKAREGDAFFCTLCDRYLSRYL